MTVSRVILVRHGESTANVAATAAEAAGLETIAVETRDADVPLSPLGRQQAAALSERLSAVVDDSPRIWSSPYRRAIETAQLALGAEVPLIIDERLRDRELGILDALTSRGVDARLPAEAARRRWVGKFYYRPPGGESWTDVSLRLRSFLRDALTPTRPDVVDGGPGGPAPTRSGSTLVVFAHDAVVSLVLYILLGYTEQELEEFLLTRVVANASVTTMLLDASAVWRVETFSDDRHLQEAGLPTTEHQGAARVEAN